VFDPEHVAASERLNFPIDYRPPSGVQKELQDTLAVYTKYKADLE
jgi:hypothetical protein